MGCSVWKIWWRFSLYKLSFILYAKSKLYRYRTDRFPNF
jgi:hypothetical protein